MLLINENIRFGFFEWFVIKIVFWNCGKFCSCSWILLNSDSGDKLVMGRVKLKRKVFGKIEKRKVINMWKRRKVVVINKELDVWWVWFKIKCGCCYEFVRVSFIFKVFFLLYFNFSWIEMFFII